MCISFILTSPQGLSRAGILPSVNARHQRVEREVLQRDEMIGALLGGGHPVVEFCSEVLRPGAGLGHNRDLEILHAELRHVPLLLMVGGIGFDLEFNPPVGHRSHVRFKKKMQLVFPGRSPGVLQDKIRVRSDG